MPDALCVTDAMYAAKAGLEKIRLTVVGEVSEFNDKPGYKAAYFTIRDDKCSMPCLMWRGEYNASGVVLQAGMLVEVTGNFSCYPAKGRMQFSVRRIELAGEGKLRMQVAMLAKKLQAEGLMDASRKRRTPALPRRIAIVTSPRGKAVHDCLRTLRRRYPLGEVLIFGVQVEGTGAVEAIASGLNAAASVQPAPDVILLVRGGGSYEDLMPFNDEGLARLVAASPVPVVTGIGHEPDNSICDMVADKRCSTPTHAAESVAPSMEELQGKVNNATRMLAAALEGVMRRAKLDYERLASRPLFHDAHYITGSYWQALDLAGGRLQRAIPDCMARDAHKLQLLARSLASVGPKLLANKVYALSQARQRMDVAGHALMEAQGRELALAAAKLEALSPLKTLSRGYSIMYAADGKAVVDSIEKVSAGDDLVVQLQDGRVKAQATDVERRNV